MTEQMLELIQPYIYEQEVWDLGCGFGGKARMLWEMGPAQLILVDKVLFMVEHALTLGYSYDDLTQGRLLTRATYFKD